MKVACRDPNCSRSECEIPEFYIGLHKEIMEGNGKQVKQAVAAGVYYSLKFIRDFAKKTSTSKRIKNLNFSNLAYLNKLKVYFEKKKEYVNLSKVKEVIATYEEG